MSNTKAKINENNPLRRLYYWTLKECAKPYADWFLGAFSFLESLVIPIPTDPLLIARASASPRKSIWISFYVSIASALGGIAGYFIGLYFWDLISPWIYQFIFAEETFNMVRSRVSDNTFLFVLLGGFTPLPFKAFTLTAGSMSLPFWPFALGCLIGRSMRFMTLGVLIFFFGDRIHEFIDKYLEKIFIILGLLVALLILIKYLS